MKMYIEERVKEVTEHILKTKCTVRTAAKKFGVSKSTIYKDVTQRLSEINQGQVNGIELILATNKAIKHIHGGESTKKKYLSC